MINSVRITAMIVILSGLFLGCADQGARAEEQAPHEGIRETPDGTRYLVPPSKIRSGGPPPDGIPSIDEPRFVSVGEADEWIRDDELVMALAHGGVKRVYPIQILVWHEIVNDTVAGDPILITWCPLCGSGIAYRREIEGNPVEFGTSGKLYNSNLVMYDRKTGTYWTQIGGRAIVGELTGRQLEPVSVDVVVWRDWKSEHPGSQVLSRDTGHSRRYGFDPYGNYYEQPQLMFPVENSDDRIHPKAVVFGIRVNGSYKAYQESDLVEAGLIEDSVGGVPVVLRRDEAGAVTVENARTGEVIHKERDFWFVWYAFHPETELYDDPSSG